MPDDLLLRDRTDGVMTLTMNNPDRLNGWTMPMLDALFADQTRTILARFLTPTSEEAAVLRQQPRVVTVTPHQQRAHFFLLRFFVPVFFVPVFFVPAPPSVPPGEAQSEE